MILAATFLMPFGMLGLVFALAWVEERYLTDHGGGAESSAAGAGRTPGFAPARVGTTVVVRRRPSHRGPPAAALAARRPPGRRVYPRRA